MDIKRSALVLMLFLFSISFIAAAGLDDFTNVKNYNDDSRSVTIRSNLGIPLISKDVAKIDLVTPLENYVVPGDNRHVLIWNIESYEDYSNALEDQEILNLKRGGIREDKSYHYEYAIYEDVKKPLINVQCQVTNKDEKGRNLRTCTREEIGFTTEREIVRWERYNSNDILKGNITLALTTDVSPFDNYDAIPLFFSERLDRWATWESSFNVDLIAYYTLNESSGSNVLESVNGLYNGTMSNGNFESALIGNGFNSSRASASQIAISSNVMNGMQNFTISFWFNGSRTSSVNEDLISDQFSAGTGDQFLIRRPSENWLTFQIVNGSVFAVSDTTFSVVDDEWYNVVARYNGSAISLFVNGTELNHTNIVGQITYETDRELTIATDEGSQEVSALFDEVGIWNRSLSNVEILDLYNNGSGITYNPTPGEAPPVINLTTPANNTKSSVSPVSIGFNATITDNTNVTNASLFINSVINYSIFPSVNMTELFINQSMTDGIYYWYVQAYDELNASTTSETRTLTIDGTAPVVNITFPLNGSSVITYSDPYSAAINYSVSEAVALDSCWYYNQSANVSINCGTNITGLNLNEGWNYIKVYANDTLNNVGEDQVDIFVNLVNESWTYENPTIEQNQQYINFLLRATSITDFNATLNYNSTSVTPQSINFNSTFANVTALVTSPYVTSNQTINITANYTLNSINTIAQTVNQTVLSFALDNCTTFSNKIFNLTVVDEESQLSLSGATIEIAVDLYDASRENVILNLSNTYTNPVSICLNIALLNNSKYSLDSIIRYEEEVHANEYYNIVNLTINSTTPTQFITLYDLNLTDTTDFQLTFTGSDFLPIENALVYLDRQYISENTFKTVELPKTDSNGQTVLHMVRNDVIYNIRIIKDNAVLGNFENIIAFCQDFTIGDCRINLNAESTSPELFNYDEQLGIIFSPPSYNNNSREVTFQFATNDGSIKTVSLEVVNADIFGNRTICSDSLSSASGTLSCTVNSSIEDSTLLVDVKVDGNEVLSSAIKVDPTNYGAVGYLALFMMSISIILMFSNSKTGVLVGIGLSFIGGITLGFWTGNLLGVGAAGIWLIIVLLIGIWRLNKEKRS